MVTVSRPISNLFDIKNQHNGVDTDRNQKRRNANAKIAGLFPVFISVIALGTIVTYFMTSATITTTVERSGSGPAASASASISMSSVQYKAKDPYELKFENEPEFQHRYDERILLSEYYNLDPKDKSMTMPLPLEKYPVGEGSVIALLVSIRAQDVEEAQTALRSLAFLKGDKDPQYPAPVLIFNEGDLSPNVVMDLVQSTDRPISFPTVDFTSFPPGFDPNQENIEFRVQGRNPWGYYQMIRFWTTMIWKQAVIQRFDAVMRMDSDSCFKEVNTYLPNFMYDGLYYHSQYVGVEPLHGANYIQGMYDFIVDWMTQTKQPAEPRNTLLWDYTERVWRRQNTLPLFRTNFELSKRSFMQRGDVARFHEAITEKPPFPVLRHRWGDAVLRFLLVAVFEVPEKVMTVRPVGYFHKMGCSRREVEDALRSLNQKVVPMDGSNTMFSTNGIL